MSPPLFLLAADRNLTSNLAGSTFSNVDSGGFEAITFKPTTLTDLFPGERITVRCGADYAWDGYVSEAGSSDRGDRSTSSVTGVGFGATLLKDPTRQIYVDSDQSRWGGPSIQRQVNVGALLTGNAQSGSVVDAAAPAIKTSISTPWSAGSRAEAWYDAQGLDLGSIYYAVKTGPGVNIASLFHWFALLADDDVATNADFSPDLNTASPNSGTLSFGSVAKHYAAVLFYYDNAVGGNTEFPLFWTCLTPYGTHGLTKRGVATATVPQGFYPGDIAGHAFALGGEGYELVIDTDPNAYITRHAVYLSPTVRQQIVADMANLLGWHYGVWEPSSILGTTPRAFFTAPPPTATALVFRRDCEELQEPSIRADKLYDSAIVGYRDQAGTQRYVTTTLANPLAFQAGYDAGTLSLDLGVGSATQATALGQVALALSQSSARGSGSVTLPDIVRLPDGGTKPACLLKAGRDRLRIIGIPSIGSVLESDTRRFDTFLVRRVETTVDDAGTPRTRVEFDTGADLLEVLVARLGAVGGGL